MADGCDAADGEAGVAADEVGVGAVHRGGADQGGDLGGVDPVTARGHDEQRGAVGGEDQRVGDLRDLDAELLGGLGGGARRPVEDLHRAGRAELGQPVGDPDDTGVGVHGPEGIRGPPEPPGVSCGRA